MARTIEDKMRASPHARGFDYLRIGLATAVVLWHAVAVSGDVAARAVADTPLLYALRALILPMFFALSGFLVAGSLARSRTIEGFLTLRVLRIVPALAVEILLSALILGPLLTSMPLADYFSAHAFWHYFANVVGRIHFALPGVFEANPYNGIVNISLWTIPYELECYLAIAVLFVIGFFTRRALFLAATVAIWLIYSVVLVVAGDHVAMTDGNIPGRVLVIAYLAGVLLFLYRDRIVYSRALGWLSAAASIALLASPATKGFAVLPSAYLTVWLGLMDAPPIPLLSRGDYSYGLYLFAFPIQQTVVLLVTHIWWLGFVIAWPVSMLYAAFSWHCVEKPVLNQKKRAVAFVEGIRNRIIGVMPQRAA